MPRGGYLLLDSIVTEIKTAVIRREGDVKVAISFTGGGARGAYEAGVAEAILQALTNAGIHPAILTGTSAGAIVAMGMFIDLMYSKFPPPSTRIYFGQQSQLWRKLSDGNKGADQIAGDRACVLKFLTNEEDLKVIQDYEKEAQELENAIDELKRDLSRIRTDLLALRANVVKPFDDSFKHLEGERRQAAADFEGAISNLGRRLKKLNDLWAKVDVVHPLRTQRALEDFADEIVDFVIDFNAQLIDIRNSVPAAIPMAIIVALRSLLGEVTDFLQQLTVDVETLSRDIGELALDEWKFGGSMVKVIDTAEKLVADIRQLKKQVLDIFVIKGKDGNTRLTDHILTNNLLRGLIGGFIERAYLSSGRPRPSNRNIQQAIIDDWIARRESGEPLPDLFLTATNLSSSRATVFSVADMAAVQSLARFGVWTVDLTLRAHKLSDPNQPLAENILLPQIGVESNFIEDAVLTSSAYPCAFPPQPWNFILPVTTDSSTTIRQVLVDGGILDNTPMDIAIAAGATHVISIELTPLVGQGFVPNDDEGRYNLASILGQLINVAMDGALRSKIDWLVANNTRPNGGEPTIEIYRLAPLIAKTDEKGGQLTPDVFHFDGVFDRKHQFQMGLYDWFMQGYIDAKGLTEATAPNDLLVFDYKAGVLPSPRAYKGNARPGLNEIPRNKFWRASNQAWPSQFPL